MSKRMLITGTVLSLAVIVAIAIWMSGTSDGKTKVEVESKAVNAMTVSATIATTKLWPVTIEASGAIEPWQEAIIGAEISGQRLTDVFVDVGDVVKKGQILASFNPDTLLSSQAELKANLDQANSDRKRALSLKGTGAFSTQQIETYVNQAKVAEARLEANELQLRYTKVMAPDDGVISQRTATLGAVGAVGQELFRLIRQNRLEWRGQLTAQQLGQVSIGQQVSITLPDSTQAQASIRQIAPTLDSQSRLATIYADIESGSNAHAGMYGTGLISLGKSDVVVVPSKSVAIRDGRSYVFVLDSEDATTKTVQTPVITGRTQADEIEIVSGLKEGAKIAFKGAGFLNDGDTVGVVEADAPQ